MGSEIVLSCGKKQRGRSASMMQQTKELVLTQPTSSPVNNQAGELKNWLREAFENWAH